MGSGKSVRTDTLCRNLHGKKSVYVDYNTKSLHINYPDISPSMIEGQQQDAQEFYIKIMERLGCVCERLVNVFLCKVMQPNIPIITVTYIVCTVFRKVYKVT